MAGHHVATCLHFPRGLQDAGRLVLVGSNSRRGAIPPSESPTILPKGGALSTATLSKASSHLFRLFFRCGLRGAFASTRRRSSGVSSRGERHSSSPGLQERSKTTHAFQPDRERSS